MAAAPASKHGPTRQDRIDKEENEVKYTVWKEGKLDWRGKASYEYFTEYFSDISEKRVHAKIDRYVKNIARKKHIEKMKEQQTDIKRISDVVIPENKLKEKSNIFSRARKKQ